MRRHFVAVVAVVTLALVAGPAIAITYGTPDGNRHPNVGALLADTRDDGTLRQVCSGTLISPTVFLTAAHCTAYLESVGVTEVFVTFDSTITERSKLYSGTYYTNPDYNQSQSDTGDIAVIVFDKAIRGITPAKLPYLGQFDDMFDAGTLQTSTFTAVGYGLGERSTGGGNPTFEDEPFRQMSTSSFNALNATWLRLSQNPSKGDGGTCFGDSGGPNFLGTSNVIAGITITGDAVCRSTNVVYRLDTESARAFLDDFVTLP